MNKQTKKDEKMSGGPRRGKQTLQGRKETKVTQILRPKTKMERSAIDRRRPFQQKSATHNRMAKAVAPSSVRHNDT